MENDRRSRRQGPRDRRRQNRGTPDRRRDVHKGFPTRGFVVAALVAIGVLFLLWDAMP
ncbi:MAG: hypothetical protein AAGI72_10830 [Pseudomonadota bacterium]